MNSRWFKSLYRLITSAVLASTALVAIPHHSANAISLNPLDYFSYTYEITFSRTYIDEGEVFYAELEGKATCIKNAPVHPTEAYLRGRVVGRHLSTGTRIALSSGYETTISPVPSREGEEITAMQEIVLYFPWGSPDGEYQITAELIEAKFKAGGLWFDATSVFPQQKDMGKTSYNTGKPSPPKPTTTTTHPVPPTTTPPVKPTDLPTQPSTTSSPRPTQSIPVTIRPTTTAPKPEGPSIPPGATEIANLADKSGKMIEHTCLFSADGLSSINIEPGTVLTLQNGKTPNWLMLSRSTNTGQVGEEVLIVCNAYEILPKGIDFTPRGEINLSYYDAQLPSGMDESTLLVARWDSAIKAWISLEDSVIDAEANTVSAPFYDSGIYTILAPVSPPVFNTQNLQVFPTAANPGELVTIQCRVTNSGTIAGYYEVEFKLNGHIQEVKRISLAGGASREISFGVVRNSPGEYSVEVNGISSSYHVMGKSLPPTSTAALNRTTTIPDKASPHWVWIIYAFNGILLILIILLTRQWLARRFVRIKEKMKSWF